MKFARRIRLRALMALIVVCALGLSGWNSWGPAARWRRAIRQPNWPPRMLAALDGVSGRIFGLREPEAIAEFMVAMRDPSPGIRMTAVHALADLGPRASAAAPAMVEAARDPDAQVRGQAIYYLLLANVAPPHTPDRARAVNAAIHALNDPDRLVRMVAAQSLATIGRSDQALPVLLEALKDPDRSMRNRALYSLGQMGQEAAGAIPALVDMIEEQAVSARPDDRYQQVQVAAILLHLGEFKVALPVLQQAAGARGIMVWSRGDRKPAEAVLEQHDEMMSAAIRGTFKCPR